MTGYLKEDIKSSLSKGRKKVFYGFKGDEITIIKDSGNVLIAEDKKGNRFPVKSELVIQTK